MREQLEQYVSLLFAGTSNCEDILQEILQNTLDRYDDLVNQGKTPEAAYSLAIAGIGDVGEILNTVSDSVTTYHPAASEFPKEQPLLGRILRAVACGLYILSPVPLFILSDFGMATIGLCGTLVIVAVATILITLGKKKETTHNNDNSVQGPEKELLNLIWMIGLIIYFVVSFITGAWYITWLIFLIIGAVQGLAKACFDLRG